jgi:hypothetical protein
MSHLPNPSNPFDQARSFFKDIGVKLKEKGATIFEKTMERFGSDCDSLSVRTSGSGLSDRFGDLVSLAGSWSSQSRTDNVDEHLEHAEMTTEERCELLEFSSEEINKETSSDGYWTDVSTGCEPQKLDLYKRAVCHFVVYQGRVSKVVEEGQRHLDFQDPEVGRETLKKTRKTFSNFTLLFDELHKFPEFELERRKQYIAFQCHTQKVIGFQRELALRVRQLEEAQVKISHQQEEVATDLREKTRSHNLDPRTNTEERIGFGTKADAFARSTRTSRAPTGSPAGSTGSGETQRGSPSGRTPTSEQAYAFGTFESKSTSTSTPGPSEPFKKNKGPPEESTRSKTTATVSETEGDEGSDDSWYRRSYAESREEFHIKLAKYRKWYEHNKISHPQEEVTGAPPGCIRKTGSQNGDTTEDSKVESSLHSEGMSPFGRVKELAKRFKSRREVDKSKERAYAILEKAMDAIEELASEIEGLNETSSLSSTRSERAFRDKPEIRVQRRRRPSKRQRAKRRKQKQIFQQETLEHRHPQPQEPWTGRTDFPEATSFSVDQTGYQGQSNVPINSPSIWTGPTGPTRPPTMAGPSGDPPDRLNFPSATLPRFPVLRYPPEDFYYWDDGIDTEVWTESEDENDVKDSSQTVNYVRRSKDRFQPSKRKYVSPGAFEKKLEKARRRLEARSPVPDRKESCSSPDCLFCRSTEHFIWKCPEFRVLKPGPRYEFACNEKICIHCLSPNHRMCDCPTLRDRACGVRGCDRYHHRLLHVSKNALVPEILNWRDHCVRKVGQERPKNPNKYQGERYKRKLGPDKIPRSVSSIQD